MPPDATSSEPTAASVPAVSRRLRNVAAIVGRHVRFHAGVGVVCSVAYFDPGNWGVDLQAGSQFGYRLLFVVLLAGLFAVFLQVLASRLGCVTGLDLASHTRLLLHDRPHHTRIFRWVALYPLYVLAEIAIIATDLAELLGSAMALCMLFPSLELWQGVMLTAFDVLVLLAMGDPLGGRPVRMFEFLIAVLVLAVLICMIVIISKVDVDWAKAFEGYLPSKYIFSSAGLYTSVGILGATVMPHSLYLGSALATQDRISFYPTETEEGVQPVIESLSPKAHRNPSTMFMRMRALYLKRWASFLSAFRQPPRSAYATCVLRHSDRENNALLFVKSHINHGTVDMAGSLLGFAVLINSLIVILASAVFYYGKGKESAPASLFDAYDVIRDLVGKPAATLFAVALLAAGQSSSIIATVAGQAVSEGFIQWRTSPIVRRLVTRLLAIIPSVIVAVSVGRAGIDTLLVASQVVLSIVLPFVSMPLLWCTASRSIMSVWKTETQGSISSSSLAPPIRVSSTVMRSESSALGVRGDARNVPTHGTEDEKIDFSNGKVVVFVGVLIWVIIVAANFYVIVSLARGAST